MDSSTNSLRRGRFFITNDPAEIEAHSTSNLALARKEDSRTLLPMLPEEGKSDVAKEELKAKHTAKPIEEEKAKGSAKPPDSGLDSVGKTRSPQGIVSETTADKETETQDFHGAVVSSLKEWSSGRHKHQPSHQTVRTTVEVSPRTVPLDVFLSFNSTISSQFTAMLQLHREIMMELIHKDSRRDEQSLFLCQENATLMRQISGLEAENRSIRDSFYRIKE